MGFTPNPNVRRRSSRNDFGPSLTEQHHIEKCEIHNIMERYQKTGILDHVQEHAGTYMDYPDAPSFQEAMNQVAAAQSLFQSLPSGLRADFENDPAKFIDFMQNPKNVEAIAAYGLDTTHLKGVSIPEDTPDPEPPREPPEPSSDE
ncbi:internal scaffolding protein [Microviridae sp.]|nr:internal scaffolding protein [Microviridae sp.]